MLSVTPWSSTLITMGLFDDDRLMPLTIRVTRALWRNLGSLGVVSPWRGLPARRYMGA